MSDRLEKAAVLGGLLLSICAFAAAPFAVSGNYSWASNTISESGAQGLHGAWVARLGFLAFGISVMSMAASGMVGTSGRNRVPHWLFGALMCSVAAFSNRPWTAGVVADITEDRLHSFAAFAMGMCLILGLLTSYLSRDARLSGAALLDLAVLLLCCLIPALMANLPVADGAVQRVMFLGALVWYIVQVFAWSGRVDKRSASSATAIGGEDMMVGAPPTKPGRILARPRPATSTRIHIVGRPAETRRREDC